MHKRDYLRAVKLIKTLDSRYEFRKPAERKQVIDIFIDFFEDDNPKFNPNKFMKACDE